MGQPSQNGPLTVQPFRSLLLDIMKAPFVVPTSIVTPSWFIAVALRLLDHALSYYVLHACNGRFVLVRLGRITGVPYRPRLRRHSDWRCVEADRELKNRTTTTAWSRPQAARYYISSPLMGTLASSECALGLTGGVGISRAPRRGSAGGFICVDDTRLDVVFGGSFADCFGSDRLSPQESAIEGPAVQPITAPATAPTGPKTTAPDNAPSAASPTRSPASVTDGTHQIAITAATTIFFVLRLPCKPRAWSTPTSSFRARKNCFLLLIFGQIRAMGDGPGACEYHSIKSEVILGDRRKE